MSFTNPFGTLSNPKYDRFMKGINDLVLGKPAVLELRWRPWLANDSDGDWRYFVRTDYNHVDFGAKPEPPSPLDLKWNWDPSFHRHDVYESGRSTFWPSVFSAVESQYVSFSRTHPRAVWNIYDGRWREAIRVNGGTGRAPVGPIVELKIAELKDLQARGVITDEQLQRRIHELLQEYY